MQYLTLTYIFLLAASYTTLVAAAALPESDPKMDTVAWGISPLPSPILFPPLTPPQICEEGVDHSGYCHMAGKQYQCARAMPVCLLHPIPLPSPPLSTGVLKRK